MIQSDIAKLSTIPWAAELINDKRWTPTLSSNRFTKPTGEDSFFAETLDTGRTIRTMLTLRPTEDQEGEWMYKELLVILDLGDGLNGYAQILHGGFATTLLDETCGGLIQLNVFEKVRRFGSQHAMNYLTACRCNYEKLTAPMLTKGYRPEHSLQEANSSSRSFAVHRKDRAAGRQEAICTCDDRGRRRNHIRHWRLHVHQGQAESMKCVRAQVE